MTYETLSVEVEDGIAVVTLNRPQVLHAMNRRMFDELEDVFKWLRDNVGVRAVLLTGSGEKAFAAGADIRELEALGVQSGRKTSARGHEVFDSIETCGKPVIALIQGFALGGGCELAMACTFRVASTKAKFGQPEVKLGLIPGYGGTQRLPRLVGRAAALKLLITGAVIDGEEALRIGLVDELVPAEHLLVRGRELAKSIALHAPLAVAACMDLVRRGSELPLHEALAEEAERFGELCGTPDKSEGLRAFLEKRPPVWGATSHDWSDV